jgi:hypothetical protein
MCVMICYVMLCMYVSDVLNMYIHTTTTRIFEQVVTIFFHFNIHTYIHTYIHTHTLFEYHREVRRAGER